MRADQFLLQRMVAEGSIDTNDITNEEVISVVITVGFKSNRTVRGVYKPGGFEALMRNVATEVIKT